MRILSFLGFLTLAGLLAWLAPKAPQDYYTLFLALAGLLGIAAGIVSNLPRRPR